MGKEIIMTDNRPLKNEKAEIKSLTLSVQVATTGFINGMTSENLTNELFNKN